jgi:hypothetical protein
MNLLNLLHSSSSLSARLVVPPPPPPQANSCVRSVPGSKSMDVSMNWVPNLENRLN